MIQETLKAQHDAFDNEVGAAAWNEGHMRAGGLLRERAMLPSSVHGQTSHTAKHAHTHSHSCSRAYTHTHGETRHIHDTYARYTHVAHAHDAHAWNTWDTQEIHKTRATHETHDATAATRHDEHDTHDSHDTQFVTATLVTPTHPSSAWHFVHVFGSFVCLFF